MSLWNEEIRIIFRLILYQLSPVNRNMLFTLRTIRSRNNLIKSNINFMFLFPTDNTKLLPHIKANIIIHNILS
jgi:hypothetical protein